MLRLTGEVGHGTAAIAAVLHSAGHSTAISLLKGKKPIILSQFLATKGSGLTKLVR
jgi:hypothetical protein